MANDFQMSSASLDDLQGNFHKAFNNYSDSVKALRSKYNELTSGDMKGTLADALKGTFDGHLNDFESISERLNEYIKYIARKTADFEELNNAMRKYYQ